MLMVATVAIVGCGGSGPARTPVAGKVTLNGQPVKGGSLTFAPVTSDPNAASAPVIAKIKDDGTFEVTGGAVAGKQKLMFEPPPSNWQAPVWDGTGSPPKEPPNPYAGLKPKATEVEIAATANNLTIELEKAPVIP